jgi:hypothetical protein
MAPKKITIPNLKQEADIKADVKVDSSEIDDTPKLVKKPVSIIKKKLSWQDADAKTKELLVNLNNLYHNN